MDVLKKLQSYMGNRKILFPISLITSALSAMLAIVPFVLVWLIVRELLGDTASIAQSTVWNYAIWAVVAALGSIILYFIALMSSHLAAFRVETNMRREAMKKLVHMPLGFFDKNTSGRMRKIIDDDAGTTHTFLAHQMPDVAASFVAPIIVLVLIFVFDWVLGIAALIPLISAFVILFSLMGNKKSKRFQKMYIDSRVATKSA